MNTSDNWTNHTNDEGVLRWVVDDAASMNNADAIALRESADAWERVDAFWNDFISLTDCPHDDDWCEHETEHPQGIKR